MIPFGDSDHDIVSYTRFSKLPPSPAKTIRKRCYKDFNRDNFLSDLSVISWQYVYAAKDVDNAVAAFTELFTFVLDHHAPWSKYQQRKGFASWISKETLALMTERDRYKKEALELARSRQGGQISIEEISLWNSFKRIRNKINNRKKFEKVNYKRRVIKDSLHSSEKAWQTTKNLMGWTQKGPPSKIQKGTNLITSAKEIARLMNEFFILKVQNLRKNMPDIVPNFKACQNIMTDKQCKLGLSHVSLDKVKSVLSNLKSSKCASIDCLDSYSIKLAADLIARPIHHIITLSIMQSKFPSNWKQAKIIPIHKKGSDTDLKNYRLIAILSPLGSLRTNLQLFYKKQAISLQFTWIPKK